MKTEGKPTGKIPLERPRRRWEDHFRMDLKEMGINTRNSEIGRASCGERV